MLSPKIIFRFGLCGSLVLVCLISVAIRGGAGHASRLSQTQSTEVPLLLLNQPLTGNLKDGESHTYKLQAESGMLVKVVAMQQGVDVAVRALNLQKTRLAGSEDSFGRVGPQVLEFLAETAGEYLIQVLARPNELGGSYEIKYLEARPATPKDRTRLIANRHVSAGNGHRSRGAPESTRAGMAEYVKALTLYKQINDKAGQATSLQYIGRLSEGSDYRRALETFSAARSLWREVKDRRGEGLTTSSIGTMHLYLGNLDLAQAAFREADEIYREVGNREGEGLCHQEIGNIHRQQGDLTKALTYFQRALQLFREVGAKGRAIYVLSNIGSAYQSLGDFNQAVDYHQQSLAVSRELKQIHGISLAFINLGGIASEQGETRKALSFYQQALPLCLELGEQNCAGRTYWRLGAVHHNLGETQTALDYYAKSAAIYRRQERPVELARMLNSSGALYSLLGDKKRALTLHEEALSLSRKAQSRQDEAASLANLADLHQDQGQTQNARESYQQALNISREIRNRQSEAVNLSRLGLLASSTGNKLEAIKYFEQALAISNELGAKPNGAVTLNNLGVVYERSGESKLALDYFNRALGTFRDIENKTGEAMMLYRVASVQKNLGQTDEARRHITVALEIVETIRGKIASTDLRSSYFATVQQYYDLYVELLMQDHRARPNDGLNFIALQASEQARARSLLDLLQEAGAEVRHNVDPSLLAREKELVELINGKAAQQTLFFADPKKVELAKTLGEEISRLEIEYETLQSTIRERNPRYAELVRGKRLALAEIQRMLDERTVMLEYRLGDVHSYLWVVSQTKFESYVLPPRAEIEREARQYYELLTERNRTVKTETTSQRQARIQLAERKLLTLADNLRRMLLGPISPIGDKLLVIVGDGALQYVPFAVLAGPDSEVVSLPSIAVLEQLRRQKPEQTPSKSVAVFADPVFESDDPRLAPPFRRKITNRETVLSQSQGDFDFSAGGRGLPRLFASREEAQAILALAPAGSSDGALDFAASRERVMNSDLNQYRVIHFATHALLNNARPQLSGVVLSLYDEKGKERDGFLRLNQIYNLRLSSDLVVLSACSTALGKDVRGEGLVGLTRGFLYAGAPRVIASLWKVDDEATAELMKIFYRNLLQKRMSPSQALTASQREMQTQPRWRSPYYWAAFVLQGDWR